MRQVFANLCVFGLIAGFSALSVLNPDVYYQHVQEDQPLEWATFWGFMAAAVLFMRAAILQRERRQLPWFFAGLATFCVLVAMEEISWGQRLLGYSPPLYFLENNYQQELNLHNVMATSLRKQTARRAFSSLYGLLLPLLERIPAGHELLAKLKDHRTPCRACADLRRARRAPHRLPARLYGRAHRGMHGRGLFVLGHRGVGPPGRRFERSKQERPCPFGGLRSSAP